MASHVPKRRKLGQTQRLGPAITFLHSGDGSWKTKLHQLFHSVVPRNWEDAGWHEERKTWSDRQSIQEPAGPTTDVKVTACNKISLTAAGYWGQVPWVLQATTRPSAPMGSSKAVPVDEFTFSTKYQYTLYLTCCLPEVTLPRLQVGLGHEATAQVSTAHKSK